MIFSAIDLETKGEHPQPADPSGGLLPWRVGAKRNPSIITNFSVYDEAYGKHTAVATDLALFEGINFTTAGVTNDIGSALLEALRAIPEDRTILVWNGLFEAAWLYAYDQKICKGIYEAMRARRWLDGQIVYRLLKNSPFDKDSYSLKDAVRQLVPEWADYEDKVNLRKVDDNLVDYNKLDTMLTTRCTRIAWERLDERQRLNALINSESCIPFGKTWFYGLKTDEPYIRQTMLTAQSEFAGKIEAMGITASTLRSPVQLKAHLNEQGVEVANTAKGTLAKAALANPYADEIREAKKLNTFVTRTCESAIQALNFCDRPEDGVTGYIYPAPRLFATYTGRGSYQSKVRALVDTGSRRTKGREFPISFALHQTPRGEKARRIIVAPDGYLILEFDYNGQESRLMADYSLCPVMLGAFLEGKDLHSVMGARFAGWEYDYFVDRLHSKDKEAKNYRQIGKIGNLSLGYRTSWRKLQGVALTDFSVKLDDGQAQMLHSLYRQTYIGVPNYWNQAINFARTNGYATSRGARRVYLEGWQDRQLAWSLEQTSINFPIQSTAADMKMLAVALLADKLDDMGVRLMFELHDALFFLVPDDAEAPYKAKYISDVMSNLPYESVFGWTPKLPLPVDCKVGRSWGTLSEVKL